MRKAFAREERTMPHYIEYPTAGGETILVEVEVGEVPSEGRVVEVGIGDRAQAAVVRAQATFEESMMDAVCRNAQAFIQKMDELPQPPDEAELAFGLKALGEGNVAVVRAGAEATYSVKLTWKRSRANG
jgi:hypothetical protein